MYSKYFLLALIFAFLLLISPVSYAQDQPTSVVGVIIDDSLNTLSFSGETSNSIRELATIFQTLGAEVRPVDLSNPIDDDIDVLVLVRPQQTLTAFQLARLWLHTVRGNHLLLALDPQNYQDVLGEDSGHGISRLLALEYGISLNNDFLAEQWFTTDSIKNIEGSALLTYPENIIAHPIVAPLLFYQLPIHIWGGRSLDVEPFVPDATAIPLLYTETAYGEVNADFIRDSQALHLTIPDDNLGRLLVATTAESSLTGSKVALLGDSELLQDAYGLSLIPGTTRPNFIANQIFAERLAAWLLGLPRTEWAPLPDNYTWLVMDGKPNDWGDLAAQTSSDSSASGFDIQAVQALSNDQFLYILVQTANTPDDQVQVEVSVSGEESSPVIRLDMRNGAVVTGENVRIPDAAIAVGTTIEIRLPLRIVGSNSEIASVCLFSTDNSLESQDCSGGVTPVRSDQFDPVPVRFPQGPLATITSNGPVNLSSAPSDNARFIGVVQDGQVFSAVGRSEDGGWVKVANGRLSAWISRFYVTPNTDVVALPVVQ